ncbi:hypothetical protein D9X91_14665 [Falsibacillus albus]|uniref:Uncharacterized protein n=1 Tax=Falsibacillus albus TaxID=2478915 RepID=A0A3L7JTY4_9BACI|nr:hypothetical protein D9X91_14665 [Falsibacillus albus]
MFVLTDFFQITHHFLLIGGEGARLRGDQRAKVDPAAERGRLGGCSIKFGTSCANIERPHFSCEAPRKASILQRKSTLHTLLHKERLEKRSNEKMEIRNYKPKDKHD